MSGTTSAANVSILSPAAFYSYLEERLAVRAIDPQETFDEVGLDSFHLMELVAAVDDLHVTLDEDTLMDIESFADLYKAYAVTAVAISELDYQ